MSWHARAVVALADGGGVKQALPRPVRTADKVSRRYLVGMGQLGDAITFEPLEVNGSPSLLVRLHGEVDSVMTFTVQGGLITGVYAVRNPEKLSGLTDERVLSR